MISEIDLIRRIRHQADTAGHGLHKGIGDDCAVIAPPGGTVLHLLTTDTLVEGVHFDLAWHPAEMLGRKAVAVNVSDVSAMGGVARFALLSLAVPDATETGFVDAFLRGFMDGVRQHRLVLIGGDTVRSGQGLVLSITMLGEVAPGQVLYRSGARVGDQIWVSGYLGEAAAGLEICRRGLPHEGHDFLHLVRAHLDPVPETSLGPALAVSGLVTAMIDMSDGLGSDLAHICEESGLGAKVRAEWLPISEPTRQLAARCGLDPVRLAISGGEDYRLLFTAPPFAASRIRELASLAMGGQLFVVGEMMAEQGVLLDGYAPLADIAYLGYDHFGGRQ